MQEKPLPIQWQKKAQRSSLLTSKDKVNLYFSPGNAWTRIEDIPSAGMERSSGHTAKGRTHPSKVIGIFFLDGTPAGSLDHGLAYTRIPDFN